MAPPDFNQQLFASGQQQGALGCMGAGGTGAGDTGRAARVLGARFDVLGNAFDVEGFGGEPGKPVVLSRYIGRPDRLIASRNFSKVG